MQEIIDFDEPTRVIMHFKEDAQLCAQHGHRLVHYQVLIDNDPSCYSPDGEFIRFEHETSEVHGWQDLQPRLQGPRLKYFHHIQMIQ